MPKKKAGSIALVDDSELIPGYPGYRTRDGRTGLDPIDTPAEWGHMRGVFIRNLFTLRLRTRDPFYLTLMFVFGAIPFASILFGIAGLLTDPHAGIRSVPIGVLPYGLMTGLLTVNFTRNILQIRRAIPAPPKRAPIPGRRRKRLPKRRKN